MIEAKKWVSEQIFDFKATHNILLQSECKTIKMSRKRERIMKKTLIFILSLSIATQQSTNAKNIPIIRTTLGLGLGSMSLSSGYTTYKLYTNMTDSTVGAGIILPFTGLFSISTGIGSALIFKSIGKITPSLINFLKRFW